MKLFNIITIVFYALGILFDILYLRTSIYSLRIAYIVSFVIAWIGILCNVITQVRKHTANKNNSDEEYFTET